MTDDRTGSAGPAPDSAREHWRDARLRRALDFAPDQLEVPAEQTKIAIKNIANQSVSTPLPTLARTDGRGWWRRLWPASPGARMPWNAAFATVLLASMVTLLWRGEPVPDARPDRDTAAPVAERETGEPRSATESAAGSGAQPGVASAASRGAASVAAPVAAQPRIPAPMSVPKPPAVAANGATPSAAANPKLRTDRPEPTTTTAPSAEPTPSVQPAPLAEPARARHETPATPEAAHGQDGARAADSAPPPLAKAAPAPPVPATQAENKAVQPPPAAAAAPAGAPGGAPTLSGAPQRSAPAATSMLGRATTADTGARLAFDQWTQARIVQGGRAFTVARDESPGLSALLVDAIPERPAAEPGVADMAVAFGTRIELLREDRVIAVLELAPPWVRYSTRPATTARVALARADPTALAALQAEIARLRALTR